MNLPLNINLILPFKDNKGFRQKLLDNELCSFESELLEHVESLKCSLAERSVASLKITIMPRSDGSVKMYYWRFKSSKQSRAYSRLSAPIFKTYLDSLDYETVVTLKKVECELIYINFNLKVIKSLRGAIAKCNEEQAKNYEIPTMNVST